MLETEEEFEEESEDESDTDDTNISYIQKLNYYLKMKLKIYWKKLNCNQPKLIQLK